MSSDDSIIARILRESAARIAAADAKVHEADCAFAAGKFDEYYQREYEKVEKAVQDEYDRAIGKISPSGDSKENS